MPSHPNTPLDTVSSPVIEPIELDDVLRHGLPQDAVTYARVGEEQAGQRLDNLLIRLARGVPKSHVYQIIRSGQVRVNKARAQADTRVQEGDVLRLPPMRVSEKLATAAQNQAKPTEFPVVYEDDAMLVIDKPAGVAVHGGSGLVYGVIEALRAARPQAKFLELVHRLDRETSGLLMVAKKRSALVRLHEQIRQGQMDKRYQALLLGRFPNDRQHVRMPLHKFTLANGERRVRVDEKLGLTSHTILNVQQRYADATLVECELKTGRTHQIRVHCTASGHPIVGDEKYGDFEANRAHHKAGLRRMFLHAYSLQLNHPLTQEPLQLQAPLPTDCAAYLKQLV